MVCSVFVHAKADFDMAESVVMNAKVQRPGVCNAIETLLVDRAVAEKFLPRIGGALAKAGVEIRGDETTRKFLTGLDAKASVKPATEADWTTEYLDLILAVRVVDGLDGALEHLAKYSSHHSDSIITTDNAAAERYLNEVDSATVYWNASTRFTDGAEFGFGAEIGISTDKLHARAPWASTNSPATSSSSAAPDRFAPDYQLQRRSMTAGLPSQQNKLVTILPFAPGGIVPR